jgi:hypothetical protein
MPYRLLVLIDIDAAGDLFSAHLTGKKQVKHLAAHLFRILADEQNFHPIAGGKEIIFLESV